MIDDSTARHLDPWHTGTVPDGYRHLTTAVAAAAAFYVLAWGDRFWSGDLAPSPFWLATASVTAIALAVPARYRPAAVVGEIIGLVTSGLILFDESVRGLITPTLGNVLETVIIVVGVTHLVGDPARIQRTRNAVVLLLLVVAACAIGGLVATSDDSSTRIGDRVESLWRWTLGDIVGELHVLPIVLFAGSPLWFRRVRHGNAELAATLLVVATVGVIAFITDSPVTYLLVPCALWLAIRFGPIVATFAAFSSALAATIVSGRNVGPFIDFSNDPVVDVQIFNIAVGISAIVGGAHALRAYHDQRLVEASEDRWRRLVESAFAGIGRVDADGSIVEANDTLGEILAVPPTELVGERVKDVLSDTDWQRLHVHRARFARGDTSEFETWAVGRDGVRRWLRVTTRPLPEGGGFFLIADLTQEHEERRRRHAAEHRLETVERDQRDQLARDLHDGPVQHLSAAIVRLSTAQRTGADHPDLAIAQEIVEHSVDHLRGTLRTLAHGNVSMEGLPTALHAALDRLVPGDSPEICVDVDPDLHLDDASTRTVFDVAREAAANGLIHADASKITVTITGDDQHVRIAVVDDGVGFDPSADVDEDHLGLRLMRSRALALGGRLTIDSEPGGGTVVTLVAERHG